MRNKVSIGEYLAVVSVKYEIDSDQLFQALVLAEKEQEATCGEFLIKCRSKRQDKAIMLITKGSKVVAQFPMSRAFLLEQGNPIKSFITPSLVHRRSSNKSEHSSLLHIKDLKSGMKQISLTAKIIEIPKPRLVYTRFGNYAVVSNAVITDDTGAIKLCLWNQQIESVSEGDTVQIENARMSTFKGESQLRIGKSGKLTSIKQ